MMPKEAPVRVSVSVGFSSVIGWLTAIGGAIPIIVKLLEEGEKGLTLAGPEKWAAILSIVALGITQLGRYIQSVVLTQRAPYPASTAAPAPTGIRSSSASPPATGGA